MSQYTPTTEQIKDAYRRDRVWEVHNGGKIYAAEFDRWLDSVKADAWDEGYRDGHNDGLSDGHPLGNDREPEENPYRKADHDA